MIEYTVVIAVDHRHVEHLKLVLLTWARFKPSLVQKKFVVILDTDSITDDDISNIDQWFHEAGNRDRQYVFWPPEDVTYPPGDGTKWTEPQRYRMLASFVHVPGASVYTPYWLKLDLDVVAVGHDDWIDEDWFRGRPAIVSHRWSYTKPADQMQKLDEWALTANKDRDPYLMRSPLGLTAHPDAGSLGHKRIISWCGFFDTEFTQNCSRFAAETVGRGLLPVPSQDGYMWYMAQAAKFPIVRANMKSRGWKHCANIRRVRQEVEKAMNGN